MVQSAIVVVMALVLLAIVVRMVVVMYAVFVEMVRILSFTSFSYLRGMSCPNFQMNFDFSVGNCVSGCVGGGICECASAVLSGLLLLLI